MTIGDCVFFWTRRKGSKFSELVIGRICLIDNTYARVKPLVNAPHGYIARDVLVTRLRSLETLEEKYRRNNRWAFRL